MAENLPLKPNAPLGLVERDNYDAYSFDCVVVTQSYMEWLASVLDESCDCRFFRDEYEYPHEHCLKERDKFLAYFKEKGE